MSAERTGIVADWKNGLIWPKLLDRADDQALADGPVVVAVGKQDRVQNLAQRRLLEDAVDLALHFAGDDVDVPLLADREQGVVERQAVQIEVARPF